MIPAPGDMEAEATESVHLDAFREAVFAACKDDIDRRIVQDILDGLTLKRSGANCDITGEAVRRRRQRLASRLKHPSLGLTRVIEGLAS